MSGLIGFVGLIVPHIARRLVGGAHALVLPVSLLAGGAFLVLADLVARVVLAPAELPLGVVTAFIGAPFFAGLLWTGRATMTGRAMTGARVEVVGLAAAYGRTRVLDGVRLTVEPGGWLAVIGPNGSGKSTLLRSILGFQPHDGLVRDRRRPHHRHAPAGPRPRSWPTRRSAPCCPRRSPPATTSPSAARRTARCSLRRAAVDRQVVEDVMDRLGLGRFADRLLRTLSGGEQQRAVLARALAQQPRVLLLDEPTAALDLGHAQQVLELIDRLRRQDGLTVLSSLHDLTLAGQYADRLALLSGGRVAEEGTPAEVLTAAALRAPLRRPRRRRAGRVRAGRPAGPRARADLSPAAEAHAVAGAQLGGRRQVGRDDDGEHRVAAGHRMVGEEQHGRAVRRHLDRARHQPLAGQLVVVRARRSRGPASRSPTRSLSAADRPPRADQRRPRRRDQPVAARAGQHAQHRARPRRRRPGRRRRTARRPRRSPTGSRSPAASGARPEPRQRVGAARAEHRRRRRCRRGPRGRCAARPAGVPSASTPPGAARASGAFDRQRPRRRRCTGAGAPVTATSTVRSARTRSPPAVTSTTAAAASLPTSRLARSAAARSAAPDRVTPMAAQPGRPRSWTVASGPGASTVSTSAPRPGSAPGVPGRSRAGGSRSTSKRTASVRPTSCQPPGRRARVDARRTGRPGRPSRRAPGCAGWPGAARAGPAAAR